MRVTRFLFTFGALLSVVRPALTAGFPFGAVHSVASDSSGNIRCGRTFASLGRLSEKLVGNLPEAYRKAISDAIEIQFGKMTDSLSKKEYEKIHRVLQEFEVGDVSGAEVLRDGSKFTINRDVLEHPLGFVFAIHEIQHLRDFVRPPSTLIGARSFTKKIETRAFLRERALILDVINRIGLDGVTDIVMQSARIPFVRRDEVQEALRALIYAEARGFKNPTATITRLIRTISPDLQNDDLVTWFQHMAWISKKTPYVEQQLSNPAYFKKIVEEEANASITEASMRRQRKMEIGGYTAVGLVGGYLLYWYIQKKPAPAEASGSPAK